MGVGKFLDVRHESSKERHILGIKKSCLDLGKGLSYIVIISVE